jgi:hypothetical protein
VSNFQASASRQGAQFRDQCNDLLLGLGFTLHGSANLDSIGVELDQVATSPSGALIWFEYKGSVQGDRPGLIRTDTLKKAIANGALLRAHEHPMPYVVLTSHVPAAGSGKAMLDAALKLGIFADVVCVYDPSAQRRLKRMAVPTAGQNSLPLT